MPEDEEHKCSECGRTFDTERGLHIHQSQVHSNEDEKEKEQQQEEETEEKENNKDKSSEEKEDNKNKKQSKRKITKQNKVNLGLRQIAVTTFILGFILGSLATVAVYELGEDEENWQQTVDLEGEPFLGDEDAPVTIVSYEDFFCPFCGAFNNEEVAQEMGGNSALPQIKEEYIEEGKVKFYFKHLPIQGGETPAIASECVAEQDHDAFWEFHDMHYERTNELIDLISEDQEAYEEELYNMVEDTGIDLEQFENCFEEQQTAGNVQSDAREAEELEITGTPGVLIEGELVQGAQSFNVFESVIESYLD